MPKRPAFQFYPGDWQRDLALRSCSLAARGLWFEMMCLMHDGQPYGHLKVGSRPLDDPAVLAPLVGAPVEVVARLLSELETATVFSRTRKGVVFSRRMTRDEALRAKRATAGKLGGNPKLLNPVDKAPLNDPSKQKPTPASSSASAEDIPVGSAARSPTPRDQIFGTGLALLTSRGVSDREARVFLGALVRDHGDVRVAEAVARAAVVTPIEPRGWLVGALRDKKREFVA